MSQETTPFKCPFSVGITRTTNLWVLIWAQDEDEDERIVEDYDLADDANEMYSYNNAEDAEEIVGRNNLYGSIAYDADADKWRITTEED